MRYHWRASIVNFTCPQYVTLLCELFIYTINALCKKKIVRVDSDYAIKWIKGTCRLLGTLK